MNLDTIYELKLENRIRVIANTIILIGSNECYEINETTRDIIENMDGTRSVREIVDILNKKYDVEQEILKQDCFEIINSLIENNIILQTA